MTQTVEQALEFPGVLAMFRRYLSSPLGIAELEKLKPLADPAQAEAELALLAEAMEYSRNAAGAVKPAAAAARPILFQGLHDVRAGAGRLRAEGATLEALEIFHLLELVDRAGQISLTLRSSRTPFPRLAELADQIGEFRPLLRDLAGKILPNGQLDDHASGALRRIRREIAQQEKAIQELLERFVEAHSEEGSLQENYITIRNERLVVPVIAGQKRRIEGVIHGASSTGHTLFVEPLETIELNNQLVRLAEQESREIERILREMTARLAQYADSIATAIEIVGRLEWLFARASFGLQFQAVIPRFSAGERARLHLRRARHPLLEDLLRQRGESAVPVSLTLDRTHRVLIISGPNTGGKTVALKTAGLLALMARAGLPVPAEEAEFPWFEQVLADIGDYQSIQESLSTFSAHISALRTMIERATADSLVLIDELGAATDPQEGGALGVAVVDHFLQAGAFVLASTHLPALKVYAANRPGVLNASVGFDEDTLRPNYRLEVGLPGRSAGLDIARRLGIPDLIIETARQTLSRQDVEVAGFLRDLHRRAEEQRTAEAAMEERGQQLARREKEIEREWQKRQTAKLKDLDRRADSVLEKFAADARNEIEKLAQSAGGSKAAAGMARRAARLQRELRDQFQATVLSTLDETRQGAPTRDLNQLAPGAVVRLRGVAVAGRVRRLLEEGKLEVDFGQVKMQVEIDDVLEILPSAEAPKSILPESVRFQPAPRPTQSLTEINVIGETAEEARNRVDKFLDTAVVAATSRVRVVHGHGMGVLRKALWQMFASHPHVEKYYAAEQREGGAGATIVELRI